MNRIRTLASTTLAFAALSISAQGCSSDSAEGPGSSAGRGGSGAGNAGAGGSNAGSSGAGGSNAGNSGAGGGGSGNTGAGGGGTGGGAGSGSSGSAGSSGAAGSGGAAGSSGSAGAAGTGGASDGGTQCGSGIRNNQTPCTAACTGSVCGLHDLGRRDCACPGTGMYQCASCTFTGGEPILTQPTGALMNCTGADTALRNMACTQNGAMCQSTTDAAHVCACWMGTWDCDDKPWE